MEQMLSGGVNYIFMPQKHKQIYQLIKVINRMRAVWVYGRGMDVEWTTKEKN